MRPKCGFASSRLRKASRRVTVTNSLHHGLPSEMLTVVLEELESAGQGGGLLGFPLMRLKATVLGGEVGETRSVGNRIPHGHESRVRSGASSGWARAARADHEAGSQHAGRARRRPGERFAATPSDHPQHRIARHGHRATRRSTACQPVRLLERDAHRSARAEPAARWSRARTRRHRMMCCRSFLVNRRERD